MKRKRSFLCKRPAFSHFWRPVWQLRATSSPPWLLTCRYSFYQVSQKRFVILFFSNRLFKYFNPLEQAGHRSRMEKLWKNPESDQLASSCQKRCCLHQRVLDTLVLIKVFIISWIMLILFSTERGPCKRWQRELAGLKSPNFDFTVGKDDLYLKNDASIIIHHSY